MPPPAILQQPRRSDRRRPPVWTPATRNVRATEHIAGQEVPDPPKHGMTPARPARKQIFQSLGIAHYHAVMRDTFAFGKGEFPISLSMPRGKSLTWDERINIVRHSPEAFGSNYHLEAVRNPQEERLRALIGVPV
jgi:hypothetical protein